MAVSGSKSNRRGSTRKAGTALPRVISNRKVARWGNSLGLRIPQEAAEQLKLREGEEVSIEVHGDSMTIRLERRKWTEAELLKGVTPQMVGGEVDWGRPVGKEVW